MSVSGNQAVRYRLDDLRRLASGLATGLGVAPPRASSLATHLLWFDAAGASSHGIASLPDWLDRIDRRQVDPTAVGRATRERAGTAVFDAQNGLAPLALETAAGIASEKARDVGIGIVRVVNLGPSGSASPIAANLAIGPFVAMVAGPGPSLAVAIPSVEGLPVLTDSALGDGLDVSRVPQLGPWLAAIGGGDGWVILALGVTSLEPLATLHEKVSHANKAEAPGRLLPGSWEAHRRQARERGVVIEPPALESLQAWANRLGVAWPEAMGG